MQVEEEQDRGVCEDNPLLSAHVKLSQPLHSHHPGWEGHLSFLRLGDMGTGAYPQPGPLKRPWEQDGEAGGRVLAL